MSSNQQTILVAYNSRGGNTRAVAQALEQALAQEYPQADVLLEEITPDTVEQVRAAAQAADTSLIGFWCDKGSCTDEVADVLQSLSGKRVFLFGTAGFGGSAAYFDRILTGVRGKLPQDAIYLGGAMCQGKMPQSVRQRYEGMLAQNPDDPKIKAMIENFDAAQPHPTKEDLAAIISAAKSSL